MVCIMMWVSQSVLVKLRCMQALKRGTIPADTPASGISMSALLANAALSFPPIDVALWSTTAPCLRLPEVPVGITLSTLMRAFCVHTYRGPSLPSNGELVMISELRVVSWLPMPYRDTLRIGYDQGLRPF